MNAVLTTVGSGVKADAQRRTVFFSSYRSRSTAHSPRGARFARGVTLVELVVFIVVIAIVMIALLQAFSGASRGLATGKMLTAATQAAQQRMEAIVAQTKYLRSTVGYAGINAGNYDPCPPVGAWANQACVSGSSTVASSANFAANICGAGVGTNCFLVTVTAIDTNNNLGAPQTLTYQVWNY